MNQRRRKAGTSATCRWLALSSFLFVLIAVMGFAYVTVFNRINRTVTQLPGNVGRSSESGSKPSEQPIARPLPATDMPQTVPTVPSDEKPVDIPDRKDEDREDRADEKYRLRNEELRTTTAAQQLSVFDKVRHVLSNHPIHQLKQSESSNNTTAFEDYFVHVKSHSSCANLPLFVSMANVFSDLYWQMYVLKRCLCRLPCLDLRRYLYDRIENFIYTMVKFDLSDCAVMVCVSDSNCMKRCQESLFPCVDFQYKQYHPVSYDIQTSLISYWYFSQSGCVVAGIEQFASYIGTNRRIETVPHSQGSQSTR